MYRIGGNTFENCQMPLVVNGRAFIVEPTSSGLAVSVLSERDGEPVLEVNRNRPVANPVCDVTRTAPGIVTASDHESGRFLYKIRPGMPTSLVFGPIADDSTTVTVDDRRISYKGNVIENNTFDGVSVGITIDGENIAIGSTMPPNLARLFHVDRPKST